VANYIPPKKVELPDITAEIEGHLWDNLMDPYAADAAKDVRGWVVDRKPVVFIMNSREVEVIEHQGVNPRFSKWKFRTAEAANKFGEFMLPYCTIIGLS
jgi:hypothetical protein